MRRRYSARVRELRSRMRSVTRRIAESSGGRLAIKEPRYERKQLFHCSESDRAPIPAGVFHMNAARVYACTQIAQALRAKR